MNFKVTVIGAGNVGATVSQRLVEKNIADVVMVDVLPGLPQGKALDISQSGSIEKFSRQIRGTNDFSEMTDSDVIVLTAGMARKPGMSRDDLIEANKKIIKEVCEKIKRHSPESIIIVVTNPLDVMVYAVYKYVGMKKERIMGMAGELDSARLAYFVADALKVSQEDISALVLGSHGDLMTPVPEYTTVSGIPITGLLDGAQIEKLIERTRNGGAEIVGLLKQGSAFYAPSSSVVKMVKSIAWDEKSLITASVLLEGEYGLKDVFIGVPVVLGKKGVERIIQIDLTKYEEEELKKSAGAVAEICGKLNL